MQLDKDTKEKLVKRLQKFEDALDEITTFLEKYSSNSLGNRECLKWRLKLTTAGNLIGYTIGDIEMSIEDEIEVNSPKQ